MEEQSSLTEDQIAKAIPSTEPASFNEFLRDLGEELERHDWRALFNHLRNLESRGLVEISRTGDKIDTLQLTDDGVAHVRKVR